jgi:hypothetical protein
MALLFFVWVWNWAWARGCTKKDWEVIHSFLFSFLWIGFVQYGMESGGVFNGFGGGEGISLGSESGQILWAAEGVPMERE